MFGAAFALDAFNVPLFGVEEIWVGALLAGFVLFLLISYFVGKKNYLAFAVLFTFISAMIILRKATDLTFAELWPMVPIGISTSVLLLAAFARRGKNAIIASYFTVIFIGVLLGLITGSWSYVIPSLLILTGVLFLLPIWKREDSGDDIPMLSFEKRREELRNEQNSENG